jgi:hypothetical protein
MVSDESEQHPGQGTYWGKYGREIRGGAWEDNAGLQDRYLSGTRYTAGSYYDNPKWSSVSGYPYWAGIEWVTFTGTLLPYHRSIAANGMESNAAYGGGYVDDFGDTTEFDIGGAVQVNGTPVTLQYIDFVKVQSAAQGFGPQTGEVSTELTVPLDLSLAQ